MSKDIPTTNTFALHCNAMSSILTLHIVLHFHALHIGPSISCPAILMVRHFHARHFQSTPIPKSESDYKLSHSNATDIHTASQRYNFVCRTHTLYLPGHNSYLCQCNFFTRIYKDSY